MRALLYLLIIFGIHFKYLEIASIGLNFYVILLFLAISIMFMRAAIRRNGVKEFFILPLPAVFLFLIALLGLIQWVFGSPPPNVKTVLVHLSACLVFIASFQMFRITKVDVYSIFKLMLIMSLCSTLFVILQTQVSASFDIVPHLEQIGVAKIYHPELLNPLVGVRGRGLGLTVGDYAMHNFVSFFFCVFMALTSRMRKRILYFLCLLLLLTGMYISNSESVYLGILAAISVYFLGEKTKLMYIGFGKLLLVALAIFLVVWLVLPYFCYVSEHGEAVSTSSVVDRLYLWSVSLSMFCENPLTGIGLGNFPKYMEGYSPYIFVQGSVTPRSAHSMIFDLLAGGGIIGLILFLGYLVSVGLRARHCVKHYGSPKDKILYMSLIAYIVMGLFGNIHTFGLDLYFLGAFIEHRYHNLVYCQKEANLKTLRSNI